MTKQPKGWEERFDEKFSVFDGWQKIIKHITYSSWIKSFISQEIKRAEGELVEEVDKILAEYVVKKEPLCEQNSLILIFRTKLKFLTKQKENKLSNSIKEE